jgi:hypothetical protein
MRGGTLAILAERQKLRRTATFPLNSESQRDSHGETKRLVVDHTAALGQIEAVS